MTESNLVAGTWTSGGGATLRSANPTTGETLLEFQELTAAEVDAAVSGARVGAPEWAATPPVERAAILNRVADRLEAATDEFGALIVAEVGKPIREAREEVVRSVAILRYHAQAALDPHGDTIPDAGNQSLLLTEREPLGAVGLITPWNFPLAILIWKLAPALAYGNAVVVKPAPHAALVAARAIRLFADLLPCCALTLTQGGAAVGAAVASAGLDGISFTGSTGAGLRVAKATLDNGTRYQGELGGKNASVVLPSADLDLAVATILRASLSFSGQKCTATSRVIVEQSVAEEFTTKLAVAFAAVVVGDPADERTDFGPLIDAESVARVRGFVERAVADGAEVLAGGHPLPDCGPAFFAPTLLAGVDPDSEVARTEIFGPVLSLLTVDGADAALRAANDTDYGLAAAVFCRDLGDALRFGRQLAASSVRVNGATPGVPFNAPFGPWKMSGIGLPEQGKAAQHFYTRERTLSIGIA